MAYTFTARFYILPSATVISNAQEVTTRRRTWPGPTLLSKSKLLKEIVRSALNDCFMFPKFEMECWTIMENKIYWADLGSINSFSRLHTYLQNTHYE